MTKGTPGDKVTAWPVPYAGVQPYHPFPYMAATWQQSWTAVSPLFCLCCLVCYVGNVRFLVEFGLRNFCFSINGNNKTFHCTIDILNQVLQSLQVFHLSKDTLPALLLLSTRGGLERVLTISYFSVTLAFR